MKYVKKHGVRLIIGDHSMTLLIGIAGGTGSGKTTVSKNINLAFKRDERIITLEFDSYYRNFTGLSKDERKRINYDHPSALDFPLLKQHLHDLLQGKTIEKPIYDFVNHCRSVETKKIKPSDIIILEGILTFHDKEIRDLLDIKIFVDTDPDIRILRRLRRDIEKRGRTFDEIRKQYYETVRPMHIQFVEPTKQWADVVIPEGGSNVVAVDMIVTMIRHRLNDIELPSWVSKRKLEVISSSYCHNLQAHHSLDRESSESHC